jgi:glycosyltransferase involved in cell wall biosynthesis
VKILHAYKIYRPDVNGGIPAVIAMLCRSLDSGVTSSIIVARAFGWFRKYLIDGVPVRAITSLGTLLSMPVAPSFPHALKRLSRNCDILVHHAPFPLTDLAISMGLPKPTALIVYWHAEIVGRSALKWLLSPMLRSALRRADRIVVSHPEMAQNSPFLDPYANKTVVVPYAVDTRYWSGIDGDQQNAVNALRQTHPRLVVAIGRLVGYKGYDVLLQAIQQIDAQAMIVGAGPLQTQLEDLARSLGISDRVTFRGGLKRDDIKTLLHAARVFALPSVNIAEAFGIVQIEAMAAGRPVVNTSLPTAVPHIARHELEGLTVAPGDPDALAGALQRLLDNPEYAETLGAAGRARAIAEYDEVQFQARMKTVYDDATKHRRAAS